MTLQSKLYTLHGSISKIQDRTDTVFHFLIGTPHFYSDLLSHMLSRYLTPAITFSCGTYPEA